MKKLLKSVLVVFLFSFMIMPEISNAEKIQNIDIGLKFGATAVSSANFKTTGLAINDSQSSKYLTANGSFTAKPVVKIYVDETPFTSFSDVQPSGGDFVFAKDINTYYKASLENKYKNEYANVVGIYDNQLSLFLTLDANSNLFLSSSDFSTFEIFGRKYRGKRRDATMTLWKESLLRFHRKWGESAIFSALMFALCTLLFITIAFVQLFFRPGRVCMPE